MLRTIQYVAFREGDARDQGAVAEVEVRFNHAEGLMTTDHAAPGAFWLASEANKWVPAKSKISGESVLLSAEELQSPKYVRYAFAGFPYVNLINEAGLPAVPFRTDEFLPSD